MDAKKLTPEEQISLIEKSLKHSSGQKTGARSYYLIWGFVLFTYFILQFFHAYFKTETTALLANNSTLLFAIGGILSFLQSRKDAKNETIVPLNEKVYSYGWIGASVGVAVLCMGYLQNFIEILCVAVLVIFGLVNFIIGGITNFKPLVIGGILSMLLCLAVPYINLEIKFLIAAIGILCTCIVPGYLMKDSKANV